MWEVRQGILVEGREGHGGGWGRESHVHTNNI